MFDKLFEAQRKADEIKKRLDGVHVSSEISDGAIRVVASGNKEIKEILIDEQFLRTVDKEELEELLVVVVNKALKEGEQVNQAEMQAATKDLLGGLNL